jgi:hypothetical protein
LKGVIKMAFKFNITNVCKDCYREIPFDVRTDEMLCEGDIEFEVQSGMCEECLKEFKNKITKEITEKIIKAFKKSITDTAKSIF